MIEINDRDFDKEVLECELPVLACFVTPWCYSCYPTCLFASELAEEYDGRAKFAKVDVEEGPEIAERYNVIPVPTILLFQDSHPVKKLLGFQGCFSLRSALNNMTAGKGLSYQ